MTEEEEELIKKIMKVDRPDQLYSNAYEAHKHRRECVRLALIIRLVIEQYQGENDGN